VIKALETSLKNSNQAMTISSEMFLISLEEKKQNYTTKERANIWYQKASQVQTFYSKMFNYIEELKKMKGIKYEQSQKLFTRLREFNDDVLRIDSSVRLEFTKSISDIFGLINEPENIENEFYTKFFKNSNPTLTSAILTKFQNDITFTRNKITLYCKEKIGSIDEFELFESFSALVGQSSSYVRAGEVFEINAGVGAFSKRLIPEININGTHVNLDDHGMASKKITAHNKPGKYSVPVTIKFINSDGKHEEHQIIVEYTVAKECDQ
jgi:hypothetical protein